MEFLILNLLLESILDFRREKAENMQICVFGYFPFDHIQMSKTYSKIGFKMRMSIFLL